MIRLHRKRVAVLVKGDVDFRVVIVNLAAQEKQTQRVQQLVLNRTTQRASTHRWRVAYAAKPVLGLLIDHDPGVAAVFDKALLHFLEADVDDAANVHSAQFAEGHNAVNAIDELGREVR